MTPKETIQEIKDAEARIQAYRNRIQVARTDRDNPEFFNKSRAELVAKIALMNQQLLDMDERHANADKIIADSQKEIARLKKFIVAQQCSKDIAKLLELARLVNELGGQVTVDVGE